MNRRENIERAFFALGASLFATGVFANQWMLAALFSPDGVLAPWVRRKILLFDLGCVAAGFVLMRFRNRISDAAIPLGRRWIRDRETVFRILSIVLPFLLLEGMLRLSGRYSTYAERNQGKYASAYNQTNKTPWILDSGVDQLYVFRRPEFDYVVSTNSEGIRDIEHAVHKPNGEYRIVGLGDSFTMGLGAEYQNTYLKVLERRLRQDCPRARISAICGGVSGSDPVYSYFLLRKRLIKYKPDLVILLINETDVCDIMTRGGMDRFGPDGILKKVDGPKLEWLFARSHLIRAVLMTFFHYDYYLLQPEERRARERATIPVFAEVAERLQELGRRYGFDVLVLAQPYSWNNLKGDIPEFSRLLDRAVSKKRVPYVDLTGYIEPRIPEQEWNKEYKWPIDGHYNAKGYDLLAQGIEEVLRTRLSGETFPCHGSSGPK